VLQNNIDEGAVTMDYSSSTLHIFIHNLFCMLCTFYTWHLHTLRLITESSFKRVTIC